MKTLTQLTAIVILAALMAGPVFADTLLLKTGERVNGYFEGGSARVVKFRLTDGVVKDYDIFSVQTIQFGETSSPITPSTTNRLAPANPAPAADTRLRPGAERPPAQPASGIAANTAYTIPTGTKVTPMSDIPDADRLLKEFALGELWYMLGEEKMFQEQPA